MTRFSLIRRPVVLVFSAFLACTLFLACSSLDGSPKSSESETETAAADSLRSTVEKFYPFQDGEDDAFLYPGQLAMHVRRVYQDSRGTMWVGSNVYGLMRHNRDSLEYFETSAIRGIQEDEDGNVWFASGYGILKYDRNASETSGKDIFTSYISAHGLVDDDVWCMTPDLNGLFWIGTANGACTFDARTGAFNPVDIPKATVEEATTNYAANRITCITEDQDGNLWFGTDGFGMWRLADGTWKHFSKTDGLLDNNVSDIIQDQSGMMWVSTMYGGVQRFHPEPEAFEKIYPQDAPGGMEVWNLYEAKNGDIWFPVEGPGIFRWDGESLTNYNDSAGFMSHAIQCFHEDREGRFWVGGWGGLNRFDPATADLRNGQSFYPVTRNGSWD